MKCPRGHNLRNKPCQDCITLTGGCMTLKADIPGNPFSPVKSSQGSGKPGCGVEPAIVDYGNHITSPGPECPRCTSSDTVKIGRFNPDEGEFWKCLDCEKEFE